MSTSQRASASSTTPRVFERFQRNRPTFNCDALKYALLSAVCCIGICQLANCDDGKQQVDQTDKAKAASKRRLELMQSAIDSFSTSSMKITSDQALQLGKTPKLRYHDAERNLLDAGVWRLGDGGRPTAFVTIELYGATPGKASLSYEFVSVDDRAFVMESPRGPTWKPAGTTLKFSPITPAPNVNDSEKARLSQMREIARRFAARQEYMGEKSELRLLPQPIDRYQDPGSKIVDAAVFVFANGTNPELGLILETDGNSWTYGIFRLASAKLELDLDGKEVAEVAMNFNHGPNLKIDEPYMAINYEIDLPK